MTDGRRIPRGQGESAAFPGGRNLIDLIAGEGELCGAGSGSGTWGRGDLLRKLSPIDLRPLAAVRSASTQDYREIVDQAATAFSVWRMVPAPKRGEVVRQIGTVLRWHKRELAEIVSREVGKTRAEAEGEIQEMIDMADFAVGLSRMLYGVDHAERAAGAPDL